MDIITSAIKNKFHICSNKKIMEQTWEQFENESFNKKVFIYGAGKGLFYLLHNISINRKVEAIVDNDISRRTTLFGWENPDVWHTCCEGVPVVGIECLKKYPPEKVAVLITSTKFYQEMIAKLCEYGIKQYYVMLMMEFNRRGDNEIEKKASYGWQRDRDEFVDECCKIDINPKKIVMSYGEYGGHAKYITKQLLKCRKDLEIVWLVYEPDIEVPEGVRIAPIRNWKSYIYELETAKIWLFDVTVLKFIKKRPEQIYIQTKHWSSITLKKFYFDDKSSCKTKEDEEWIKYNGTIIDYMFVGSEFDIRTSKSGFCFNGKNVQVGSSRTDALFDKKLKEYVYQRYNLNPEMKAVLYAPTFRQTHNEGIYDKTFSINIDLEELRQSVKKRFGGEWYVWVRLHPLLKFEESDFLENHYIINMGEHPDSQELVSASEVMVTDYSSIMFEPAFVKKPVFLYAPDKREYINKQRELLIDYDTLPFPIAETIYDLEQNIQNFSQKLYEHKLQSFFDYYGVCEDGQASKRAAKFILSLIGENEVV